MGCLSPSRSGAPGLSLKPWIAFTLVALGLSSFNAKGDHTRESLRNECFLYLVDDSQARDRNLKTHRAGCTIILFALGSTRISGRHRRRERDSALHCCRFSYESVQQCFLSSRKPVAVVSLSLDHTAADSTRTQPMLENVPSRVWMGPAVQLVCQPFPMAN